MKQQLERLKNIIENKLNYYEECINDGYFELIKANELKQLNETLITVNNNLQKIDETNQHFMTEEDTINEINKAINLEKETKNKYDEIL